MSGGVLCASFVHAGSNHIDNLFGPVVATGLAYGGLWAVLPSMLMELLGEFNFGKVWLDVLFVSTRFS